MLSFRKFEEDYLMKNLIRIMTIIVLLPTVCWAGSGRVSGGAGTFYKDSSWFSSSNDIYGFNYCIKRSSNFPQTEESLKELISKAFNLWRSYPGRDGFRREEPVGPNSDQYLPSVSGAKTALNFMKCDEGVDIIFYFGKKKPGY